MGRRVKITELSNGTVTSKKLYSWIGGTIVCERDGLQVNFPITKRFFSAGEVRGTDKLYYTRDHLGSIRQVVDAAGVVRADYRYRTYGERSKESGDLDSDWGYAGLWHHAPSGLFMAAHRIYDATRGRWLSRDPMGEGTDRTLYSYVGNSPINFTDLSGLVRLKLQKVELKVRDKNFCGKHSGTVFAVVTFQPYYETDTGQITLEDFRVDQKAFGILSGIGEVHVDTIRLISPPDNPRGMGVPTPVPQNTTVHGFMAGRGASVPSASTTPVINSDMRLSFSVAVSLNTGRRNYWGARSASAAWFHIGVGAQISHPRWSTDP